MICTYKYCACCCCIPKTASLAFAIFGLILATIYVITFLVLTAVGGPYHLAEDMETLMYNIAKAVDGEDHFHDVQERGFLSQLEIYTILNFVVSLHYLIVCSLLVYGTMREKKYFLLPYIFSNVVLLIGSMIIWGFEIYYVGAIQKETFIFSAISILPVVTWCFLGALCVREYYKQLKKNDLVVQMRLVEKLGFPVVSNFSKYYKENNKEDEV